MIRQIVLAFVSVIALTAAASAADMYVPGPAPAGPGSYKDAPWLPSWTGFYVGVQGGGAWGNSIQTFNAGLDPPLRY